MTVHAKTLVRHCPNCASDRPVTEILCEGLKDGAQCLWPLSGEEIREEGALTESPDNVPHDDAEHRRCLNGHAMEAGDELCLRCGADAAPVQVVAPKNPTQDSDPEPSAPEFIGNWLIVRKHDAPSADTPFLIFDGRGTDGREVQITLYRPDAEPDPAVHEVLSRMDRDHVPELIETGRHDGRAFEITERIAGGSLADRGFALSQSPEGLRRLIDELGRALAAFSETGLRHRDLNPNTILLRSLEPLDLVITGFGSARLSDFDLDAVAPLELTRYSAPEAIVGAVSAASDWWSLGMIVLEQATAGRCFEGIDDQAFRLHVVTRGVPLPDDLSPEHRLLLRGLLARDPLKRWSATKVRAWLAGEAVDAPEAADPEVDPPGPMISIAGRSFARPDAFALAAAELTSWEAARELVMRGGVATWLVERKSDPKLVATVRALAADEQLDEDLRLALVLMALNPALPLSLRGEIVTPAWLLAHPAVGYTIITGKAASQLERMDREPWLVRLRLRADAVRDRVKLFEVELDEERARVALLASSRANLEAERDAIRRVYPDTDHPGLASIVERGRLSDEDLIILVAAASHQFIPLATISAAAQELAAQTGVAFDLEAAEALLICPRRELFAQVDRRIANFARCGIQRIDEWADAFRVERRMPLPRAAVLLAVPEELWQEPPRQQYVATLLSHFEKRVSGTVSRGPLARFSIGKTTPRLDLWELGTGLKPAQAVLNHVLSRADVPIQLDPAGYLDDENRESRLRRLVSHAATFRRDTGIDGRTLGFPFLVIRDGRGTTVEAEARPRVAPVLLWPVVFDMQPGSGVATVAFDREREEVRLNPALEGILGQQIFQKWRVTRDELLGRSALKTADVIDAFGVFAKAQSRDLVRLPSKDAKVPIGTFELFPAAAIFNAEFTGQSVAEDLRQMARMPPGGTGLDVALRISAEPPLKVEAQPVRERERFIVVESDPSQDAAVQRSRIHPGLLVEGPPGTGKSQTIVNVVADAVGQGQSVLVVCQKQAALTVVKKRLDAEGLGDRLFMVVDINRDREAILRDTRDQLAVVRAQSASRVATIRRQREEASARIEVLEGDIDRHHAAIHTVDDLTGLSYRELLSELVGIENDGPTIDVPGLRPILGGLDRGRMSAIEETCAPLSRRWLEASFEDSPLESLKPFAVDTSVSQAVNEDFSNFIGSEADRRTVLANLPARFDVDDPSILVAWLQTYGPMLEGMSDLTRKGVAAWLDLFHADARAISENQVIRRLEEVASGLNDLESGHHDHALHKIVIAHPLAALRVIHADATRAAAVVSAFGRLSPRRWSARKRSRALLASHGEISDDARIAALRDACGLEIGIRPLREQVAGVRGTLRLSGYDAPPTFASLTGDVKSLLSILHPVADACAAILACPRLEDAINAARTGTAEAYVELRREFEAVFARYDARQHSQSALSELRTWFRDEWVSALSTCISRNQDTAAQLDKITASLGTLESYQWFRARAAHLDPDVLKIFRILRSKEVGLRATNAAQVGEIVRRTIRREALLAWKGRLDAAFPELSLDRAELDRKVGVLANLDRDFRGFNRELLRLDTDASGLGSATAWDDITRLRGARARRLREVIDQGADIGLMRLRPIWLMNPDVASRVLPLKAGLFDLVVYDEASQMPVEYAVPTLFRAKRILIAGDEKQMPPSNFFSGRIDDDEDEGDDENFLDEGATESERNAREETWNRREVKDCPDLLQLGRGVLPSATLQIHYRSKFRELISYSNAAFYKGDLSVPVRHPQGEVQRIRPVEVVRVDGVYENQTNISEAESVVEWLAQLWAGASEPPSIGVVTFNRKQADLVEELVERRAEVDPEFLRVYRRERDRTQAGEDMGFFVKNVENVQGDERDVIVFSTTFGRDRRGTFRRNFGVLGQAGGERRLNVAITRARDKVVLVTSMPVPDISDWLASGRLANKPRDYLQAYLEYAERMSAGELDSARDVAGRIGGRPAGRARAKHELEDGFASSVANYIRELGYDPIPASEGDAFGIDFAVEDPRTRLFGIGIECDAPRHELLKHARHREIWRPSVLRRAIPVMHRVSSYAWYHCPEEERGRLQSALKAALS